jgi:hypothetical protein
LILGDAATVRLRQVVVMRYWRPSEKTMCGSLPLWARMGLVKTLVKGRRATAVTSG